MNSKIFKFAFKEYFPELLGDTRELSKIYFETVAIKPIEDSSNKVFENLVFKMQKFKLEGNHFLAVENEIEQQLATLYDLTASEINLIYNRTGT